MAIIKPATPGFLTTLAATIILAIVSFSVPYFKSVYFLKASLAAEGQSGDITFGTLGYCVILNNTTKCSNATVGYELSQLLRTTELAHSLTMIRRHQPASWQRSAHPNP